LANPAPYRPWCSDYVPLISEILELSGVYYGIGLRKKCNTNSRQLSQWEYITFIQKLVMLYKREDLSLYEERINSGL
jgi:hypothetical protein